MDGLELLRRLIEEIGDWTKCDELHKVHGDVDDNACRGRFCAECQREALRKAADLVEAELDALKARALPEGMEWPCYEDGELVRLGDVVSDGDETGRVYYVTFDTVNPVIIGFTDEESDRYPVTWLEVSVNDGERVKRPAPKVLDADGAEIRVGDTVYDMVGDRHEVKGFGKQGDVLLEFHNDESLGWRPSNFTHRAPVIAADGRPLREGETVWDMQGNGPYEVEGINSDGTVRIKGNDYDYFGDDFTHERPDSWERLEADAKAWVNPTMEERADLVRRAKKLAGIS